MTKLPMNHKRLHSFFGFEPIQVMDPDKSVAMGAVVYHYYLYRGEKVGGIVNETIGISGHQETS
jgi:molecular chaperone DnaK (HSP70)